jgi:hypothetical protein
MAMAASVENVEAAFSNLSMAVEAPLQPDESAQRQVIQSHLDLLESTTIGVRKAAATVDSEFRSVQGIFDSHNFSGEVLGLLHQWSADLSNVARKLQETSDAIENAVHLSVFESLTSFGSQEGLDASRFLSPFELQIKAIIKESLSRRRNCYWQLAEDCYFQARNPLGTLNVESCFNEIMSSPNLFSAESWQRAWERYRIRTLNNTPDGPTLFYLPGPLGATRQTKREQARRHLF